jgi:hypothetical protein
LNVKRNLTKSENKSYPRVSAVNLRVFRFFIGLKGAQLARIWGIPQTTYASYEAETPIGEAILTKIYDVGVSLDWLNSSQGPMFRPGFEKPKVIRDDHGKPSGLVPVLLGSKAEEAKQISPKPGISVEHVCAGWLIVGGAVSESRRDILKMDQEAIGILIGKYALELSRNPGSFEEARDRLREQARVLVSALREATT